MTEYTYRITAICPANLRPQMRAISAALGYGARTFKMPLYPEGGTSPTHYASSTIATQDFYNLLTDANEQDEALASIDWTEHGFSGEEEVRLLLRAQKDADPAIMVIGDAATETGTDQLQQLLDAHGLQRVQSEEEP